MYYSDVMEYEKKMNLLHSIDMCLILKLSEQYLGEKLSNATYVYSYIEIERSSYEDYWWGLSFFVEATKIGELYLKEQSNVVDLTMPSLTLLKLHYDALSEDDKNDLDLYIEEWESKRIPNLKRNTNIFQGFIIRPDDFSLTASASFSPEFQWHIHCKDLIELDTFCKNKLKEIL